MKRVLPTSRPPQGRVPLWLSLSLLPRVKLLLIAAVLVLVLAGTTHRAPAQDPEDDLPQATLAEVGAGPALIITVDKYDGESAFRDLPGIKQDGENVKATLLKLGFGEKDITLLVNPTRDRMLEAMDLFGRAASATPKASFLYYSGHGVLLDGLNYLVPARAPISVQGHLATYAVPVEHALDYLGGKGSGPALVFLDACRNNLLPRTAKGAISAVQLPPRDGVFIGYATGAGSFSNASEEGSVFTFSLCRRLLTPGRSLDDLYAGVIHDVQKITAAEKFPQRPQKESSLGFVLHLVPGVATPAVAAGTVAAASPTAQEPPEKDGLQLIEDEIQKRFLEALPPAGPAGRARWVRASPSSGSSAELAAAVPGVFTAALPETEHLMKEVLKRVPEAGTLFAEGFRPLKFDSLEKVTKDWKEIPPLALALCSVEVDPPVNFVQVADGKRTAYKLPAGRQVSVLSQNGDMLTLALHAKSAFKAEVSIDGTSLKKVIADLYEAHKVRTSVSLCRRELFARAAALRIQEAQKVDAAGPAVEEAPRKNASGGYDVLLESMKLGQVTEITAQNVIKWSAPQRELLQGRVCWTIMVEYIKPSLFGKVIEQAQAQISGGKVQKWIYTDVGEAVP